MRALLALLGAAPALADLPVHCLHSQIAGEWTFHLGAVAAPNEVPNCSEAFTPVMKVRVDDNRVGTNTPSSDPVVLTWSRLKPTL